MTIRRCSTCSASPSVRRAIGSFIARTGEEALAQARAHRPQAITLDVLMPRMDGWAVLVALKADPELRDIPVVVVTILKDRGMAFSLGAADFMTKPVDRAGLTAMLRRYCSGAAAGPVLLVEDDPATREADAPPCWRGSATRRPRRRTASRRCAGSTAIRRPH